MRVFVEMGLCLVVVGCGPKVGVDSDSESGSASASGSASQGTDGATTSRPGPDDDGGGPSSDVTSGGGADSGGVGEVGGVTTGFFPDGGTVEPSCEISEAFTCATGVDCELYECGDPFSPFDEKGCLRQNCPCDAGETCFQPAIWGGCASSELFCEEVRGQGCLCGGSDDCGGSYCLPDELVPPLPCLDFTDEVSCVEANCTWFAGRRASHDPGCDCNPSSGVCVAPAEYELGPEPAAYYLAVPPQDAVLLPNALGPVPQGLLSCNAPDAAPACQCVLVFEC